MVGGSPPINFYFKIIFIMVKIKGISFKSLKGMKVGEVKKLDKDFKKFKVPNIQLVKDYGKKTPL